MDPGSSSSLRPLIVTGDQDLLDQLLRLCAAANLTPDLAGEAGRARQPWAMASAVLVGDDLASSVSHLRLSRRDHVVLVSQARDATPLWQLAVELGADDVAVLPAAQGRLIERLSDLADGTVKATTLGIIGGCGGAGSSTLAAGLALTAAKAGRESLLIDADPLGGGLELVVGCEGCGGLRWPEVAATKGRVTAVAFRAALPAVGRLAVLSWQRSAAGRIDPETMRAMVGAAQRGSELVVVDLPRHLDAAAAEVMALADLVVLVTTTEVRGVAGAEGVLGRLRQQCVDIRLVVRELPGSDLTSDTIAESLGLPLLSRVSTQRVVARAVNDGLGPLGRGRLERSCREILESLPRPRAGRP